MTLQCSEHVYFFAEFEIYVHSVCNGIHLTHLTLCCHQSEVLPRKEMGIYDVTFAVYRRGIVSTYKT